MKLYRIANVPTISYYVTPLYNIKNPIKYNTYSNFLSLEGAIGRYDVYGQSAPRDMSDIDISYTIYDPTGSVDTESTKIKTIASAGNVCRAYFTHNGLNLWQNIRVEKFTNDNVEGFKPYLVDVNISGKMSPFFVQDATTDTTWASSSTPSISITHAGNCTNFTNMLCTVTNTSGAAVKQITVSSAYFSLTWLNPNNPLANGGTMNFDSATGRVYRTSAPTVNERKFTQFVTNNLMQLQTGSNTVTIRAYNNAGTAVANSGHFYWSNTWL